MHRKYTRKHKNGFTIVELLIVVVVIAILATITLVTFNGIQQKAVEASFRSSLSSVRTQAETLRVSEGKWPFEDDVRTKLAANDTQGARNAIQSYFATRVSSTFTITNAGTLTDPRIETNGGLTWVVVVQAENSNGDNVGGRYAIGSRSQNMTPISQVNAATLDPLR